VTKRIIDISTEPLYLSTQGQRLRLRSEHEKVVEVPFDEVQAMLLSHPQSTVTVRTLSDLATNGVATVVCDSTHRPTGIMLPIQSHTSIASRFLAQSSMKLPVRKRLWRQIVQGKLQSQSAALRALHRSDGGIRVLVSKVTSGDRTNVEAQAAVRYWKRIFNDPTFRRDAQGVGVNAALNYGYSVLRASMARAICGAGLHPALGLHHHQRDNPLCLADDLMEPFRPIVDVAVARFRSAGDIPDSLDPPTKRMILNALTSAVRASSELRTPFDIQEEVVHGLVRVIEGESVTMWLPDFDFSVSS